MGESSSWPHLRKAGSVILLLGGLVTQALCYAHVKRDARHYRTKCRMCLCRTTSMRALNDEVVSGSPSEGEY